MPGNELDGGGGWWCIHPGAGNTPSIADGVTTRRISSKRVSRFHYLMIELGGSSSPNFLISTSLKFHVGQRRLLTGTSRAQSTVSWPRVCITRTTLEEEERFSSNKFPFESIFVRTCVRTYVWSIRWLETRALWRAAWFGKKETVRSDENAATVEFASEGTNRGGFDHDIMYQRKI